MRITLETPVRRELTELESAVLRTKLRQVLSDLEYDYAPGVSSSNADVTIRYDHRAST